MATNYPGALDAYIRPTATSYMDDPNVQGDVVVDNLYDAVEAVQAELGVNPSGTHGTVAARLAQIGGSFNVSGYGAVGDGATNDTTAIQNALNAAASAGGGVVFFPRGVYMVDGVTFGSKVTLAGEGPGVSVIKARANIPGAVVATTSWASTWGTGISQGGQYMFTVRDLTIDGNRTGQTTQPIQTQMGAPTMTPSTTGGTLAAGTNYSYRIQPINTFGHGLPSPRPASQATTTGSTSSITVTWSAVTGATGYIIYGRLGYQEQKLTTVGAVTTWTDTGALSTQANGGVYNGNTSASTGLAVYGYEYVLDNIQIVSAAGTGFISEWFDNGTLPPAPGGNSMEALISNSRVYDCGTHGIIWRGPHDSQMANVMSYLNSTSNTALWTNALVDKQGPMHFLACHMWGQGSWQFEIREPSFLEGCVAEGGRTGQIWVYVSMVQIIGGESFSPQSASSVGVKWGDANFSPWEGTLVGHQIRGFSSASGAALDLQYCERMLVQTLVQQDTGTVMVGDPLNSDITLRLSGSATQPVLTGKPRRTVLAATVANSTVTGADITGLGVVPTTAGTYTFRGRIAVTAAAVGTGIQIAVNGPATNLAYVAYSVRVPNASGTELLLNSTAWDTYAASLATQGTTPVYIEVTGVCRYSGTPNAVQIVLRMRSEVAASAVTAQIGSYFEVEKLGSV